MHLAATWRPGSARSRWESLSAPPDLLATFGGGVPTSKGKGREEGKGRKGIGRGERKGRGVVVDPGGMPPTGSLAIEILVHLTSVMSL